MKKTTKILSIIIIINIIISLAISIFSIKSYAVTQTFSTDIDSIDDKKYPGIKSMIQALQKAHQNWNFKLLYTGLDWEDVIKGQAVHGKNLVGDSQSNYSGNWICSECGTTKKYSGGSWLCVSEEAIKYMMDPRNSLYYADVFQFLELSYDESIEYDESAIKKILENTFLDDGNLDKYIKAIMDSCKKNNVNPYYLTVKIIQEQGTKGGSTFKMSDTIFSEKVSLNEENKILTVRPDTTVKNVLDFLGGTYIVKDKDNVELKETENVKTGCMIEDKYKIVMLGDVNGDGKVKATDYMRIKNYIMGDTKLNEYEQKAADVNLDDKVKATDYMKIKNYIMGDSEISVPGITYYYNLFNINATGITTQDIVKNALSKAKEKGWTSIEKCIDGGAKFISGGYISAGQDTMYFEKFNVVKPTYYTHQYAQDVLYAQNQGTKLRKALESINSTECSFTFVIPIYENMPSEACARPKTN